MKIRTSEVFASFQGEGLLAGVPTIWVRLFGCNLKCDGFGQKTPTDSIAYILPYQQLDASLMKSLSDLPVFEYGCDSSYSWAAKFKHLAKDWEVGELVDELLRLGEAEFNMNPANWSNRRTEQSVQLCFTGGEPMLQQAAIEEVLEELRRRQCAPNIVSIETNATRPLSKSFARFLRMRFFHLHFACSPKLYAVSGEKDAVKLDVIEEYMEASDTGALKFVMNGNEDAWEELDRYTDDIVKLMSFHSHWDAWVMPVGATKEQQERVEHIAREAMKRGFFVATRNHTYVFGNKIGS